MRKAAAAAVGSSLPRCGFHMFSHRFMIAFMRCQLMLWPIPPILSSCLQVQVLMQKPSAAPPPAFGSAPAQSPQKSGILVDREDLIGSDFSDSDNEGTIPLPCHAPMCFVPQAFATH